MPQFLPKDVKTLIHQILTVNPAQRITLEGIKNSAWFRSNQVVSPSSKLLEDHVWPFQFLS